MVTLGEDIDQLINRQHTGGELSEFLYFCTVVVRDGEDPNQVQHEVISFISSKEIFLNKVLTTIKRPIGWVQGEGVKTVKQRY